MKQNPADLQASRHSSVRQRFPIVFQRHVLGETPARLGCIAGTEGRVIVSPPTLQHVPGKILHITLLAYRNPCFQQETRRMGTSSTAHSDTLNSVGACPDLAEEGTNYVPVHLFSTLECRY